MGGIFYPLKSSENHTYGFLKFEGYRKLEHWLKMGSCSIILFEGIMFRAIFFLLLTDEEGQ